jgi:hypothetical protein
LDESGTDLRSSPCEVLAGVAIRDQHLWNLVCQVQEAEVDFFGRRLTPGTLEMKATKLLKRKTFRMAAQQQPIEASERTALARSCLEKGEKSKGKQPTSAANRRELTALAQAKIAFVERVFELCGQHAVRTFASVVPAKAPRSEGHYLRKDYSYLFERFFYFLEEQRIEELGLVIFDELERSQCHMLIDQMSLYFRETATGRLRAGRIIPEPFFVHSELTTAIQIADLVAYVVCWGVRFGPLKDLARRDELHTIANLVSELRYRTVRDERPIWSFTVIEDLRPREER